MRTGNKLAKFIVTGGLSILISVSLSITAMAATYHKVQDVNSYMWVRNGSSSYVYRSLEFNNGDNGIVNAGTRVYITELWYSNFGNSSYTKWGWDSLHNGWVYYDALTSADPNVGSGGDGTDSIGVRSGISSIKLYNGDFVIADVSQGGSRSVTVNQGDSLWVSATPGTDLVTSFNKSIFTDSDHGDSTTGDNLWYKNSDVTATAGTKTVYVALYSQANNRAYSNAHVIATFTITVNASESGNESADRIDNCINAVSAELFGESCIVSNSSYGQYVGWIRNASSGLRFNINATSANNATLKITYRSDHRGGIIKVNGNMQNVEFTDTGWKRSIKM